MKIIATYAGRSRAGHHLLKNLDGDLKRDHAWLNYPRSGFPEDVPVGARVQFYADIFYRYAGPRLTDVREVSVI
jgi:hypothetical protein